MIDFSIPRELETTQRRVIAFMDQCVYPNENKMVEEEGLPANLERDLQAKVKSHPQITQITQTEQEDAGKFSFVSYRIREICEICG